MPLLAGELVNADQKGACASMNKIIDDLPKTIPTAHVISSAGCTKANHLHFNPAGYRELGKRYAEKMLPLLGYKTGESFLKFQLWRGAGSSAKSANFFLEFTNIFIFF